MNRRTKRKIVRKPKRKMAMKSPNVDYATVTECVEEPLTLNALGSFGYNFTTSLSEYQRAQEVAHAYKYYRCKNITLEFVPYANIAAVGALGGLRLPQFYFTVDRVANQWITPDESEMLERGLKPILFKNIIKRSWKPSLLQNIQMECNQPTDGGGLPLGIDAINAINSVPIYNKWLPTQQSYGYGPQPPNQQTNVTMVQPASNPYALRYYGAVFVIDQEGGASVAIGDLVTKVTWEFKGQRALKTNTPLPQALVSQATSTMNNTVVPNTQPTTYP